MTAAGKSLGYAILAVLPMAVIASTRAAGPDDLDAVDQAKTALYVLDIWQHHNVILPMERGVLPATKPPLYPWLAAVASIPFGGPTETSCRIPAILASLAVALLLYIIGTERAGAAAGVAAAWIFAAAHTTARLSACIRPDMLLAALVAAAFFAFHRIESGRPRGMHFLFWLATAASALDKGPAGPLVIFGALAVLCAGKEYRPLVRSVLATPHIFWLLLPAAWVFAGYVVGEEHFVDQTLLGQTVDRALGIGSRADRHVHPPGFLVGVFLARFAPWSLFAALGVFAAFRKGTEQTARRHLQVAAAWFLPALLLLSLSRGQREDYLVPMLPAAALMAALVLREAAPAALGIWRVSLWAGAAALLVLGLSGLTGWPAAPIALRTFLDEAGPVWTAALLAGGAILGVAAFLGRRAAAGEGLGRLFFVATAALAGVLAVYFDTASVTARSGKGAAIREFAAAVNRERTPDDEIAFYGSVKNSVAFYLGINEPSIAEEEIWLYFPRGHRTRRLLLVCSDAALAEIRGRWPDEVRVLREAAIGEDAADRVYLVAAGPR